MVPIEDRPVQRLHNTNIANEIGSAGRISNDDGTGGSRGRLQKPAACEQ